MYQEIIEKIKDYKWQVALVTLGGMIGGSFLLFGHSSAQPQPSPLPLTAISTSEKVETVEADEEAIPPSTHEEFLTVDVKGAVKKAGVYELPAGSRVHDAVEMAGGLAEQADSKSVNLAQKLTDEAVIYVAAQGEEGASVADNQTATGTTKISSDSKLVNLNTASLEELQTISGVGQKKAQDIVDYRESSGGFKSVDDLGNVSGFGAKTVEKLKPYVTVD